jgi:hypothetical protein
LQGAVFYLPQAGLHRARCAGVDTGQGVVHQFVNVEQRGCLSGSAAGVAIAPVRVTPCLNIIVGYAPSRGAGTKKPSRR